MATVVKTIRTDCGQYEAEIEQRSETAFTIKLFKWTEEWVDGYGKVAEFWEPITRRAVFTDTLQNAELLAAEELRMYCTVPNEPDASPAP